MNLVDSSGWLEYFSGGTNAGRFLPPLRNLTALLVPSLAIYEVFKVVLRERGESEALQAAAAMQRGTCVDLTPTLALSAAKLSLSRRLPMADSVILATAQMYSAVIWTQDADFQDIPGVKYFPKNKS